jgi:four helix bundle protein
MSGTFRDLKCWQKAFDLTISIYRATRTFPKEEIYGLSSQLRRAAVSVVSNIAEGKGRFSDKELLQFLSVAKGSLFEVETQVLLAEHLEYLNAKQSAGLSAQAAETGRLLNGLIKAFEHERKLPRGGLQASGSRLQVLAQS